MDCVVGCRELIERIIVLGFYYREMERFSAKCRDLSWIRSANAKPLEKKEKGSVYRRALASGIVEILSVYRSAVLHIEQKLLSETMPILATVTQGLNKVIFSVPTFYFCVCVYFDVGFIFDLLSSFFAFCLLYMSSS